MIPKKIEKKFKEFGKDRIDNYFWMRDKKDPDVVEYIKYENNLSKKWFSDVSDLKDKVLKELKSRIKEKDESIPYFLNGYWYVKKFEKGKEYPLLFRKKDNLSAKSELVLDQNILAKGKKYYNLGRASVSPNNKLLAYTEDTAGDRRFSLKIKNLETGKYLKDKITEVSNNFEWSNDSLSLFYVESDKTTLRPFILKKHILGEDNSNDVVVYKEEREVYYLDILKSRSKKYLILNIGSHDNTFVKYIDISGESLSVIDFVKPKKGVIYDVNHAEQYWYIRTNEKSIDFEIFRVSDKNIIRKNWQSFIESKEGYKYNSFILFKDFFVYEEYKEGVPGIFVLNLNNKKVRKINFKQSLYDAGFLFNPEYESNKLNIYFETRKTPETDIEYDLKTGKTNILKIHKPQGRFDENKYEVKREWVKSFDGVKIPITLLYKKGIKKDSNNPCVIYGYGSYGFSINQNFNQNVFSLVDRGVVMVIAHIRGGEEMGRKWYLDGKFLKKKNTFNDFISCAEFLINQKYTNKEKLVAKGGSAGGLLMGAVANQRPDLFKAIILHVPFVDVVNTMLDSTIPLTVGEYVEWGNPNEKKYYDYMLSYSPYDNIKKQNYPTMFINSGFNDTQVHYWEPLKYIAKMKEFKTDNNPILLNMNLRVGHSGKSGRFSSLEDVSLDYVFTLKVLGIKK